MVLDWKDRYRSQISNGVIVMRNNMFHEVLRTDSMNAWGVSREGLTLDSVNSSLSISKVEIAPHGIEVVC